MKGYKAPLFGLSDWFVRSKYPEPSFDIEERKQTRSIYSIRRSTSSTFLISGASGLIGRNLRALLRSHGHTVYSLVAANHQLPMRFSGMS